MEEYNSRSAKIELVTKMAMKGFDTPKMNAAIQNREKGVLVSDVPEWLDWWKRWNEACQSCIDEAEKHNWSESAKIFREIKEWNLEMYPLEYSKIFGTTNDQ